MHVKVVAVGKIREEYWKQAVEEYSKRLTAYTNVDIVEISNRDPVACGGERQARDVEGKHILGEIENDPYVILTAIDGMQYSSVDFSKHMQELMNTGHSDVTFVVGGSTGVSDAVRERADETFSFGPITLPHDIARIVLLEQIYRSYKIMRGEPYHK